MNGKPPYCIGLQQGGVCLACYDVCLGGQVVGQAEITVQGLYYRIHCRCAQVDGIVKLIDNCEKGAVEIGICAPLLDGFGIDRCVPVKKLGDGAHMFSLSSTQKAELSYYRISREEPCLYLQDLPRARFVRRDGDAALLVIPQD